MNCLTCGLDTSRKFGEIEFDESSVVQLLPRGMGIAASLLGCLCSDLARSHMCVFGTAKKKRRNRVVNAQTSYRAGRAELLFKVKRHNQALPNSRINSDAFSLHMRYESAIRFLPKDTYSLPSYRNANSSGTTMLTTDLR